MSTGQYAPPGSQPGAGGARDEIPGAAQQAQGTAQNVAGQAQEQAQNFVGQAQEQAQQVAGQAKNRVREQIDQRSSQAGEQINQQAADLRSVSSSLREQGKDGPAAAADRLAEYAEKVGGYLSGHDSDRLLEDVEDFGRRQPWASAAGGLALGFAASRFLKASSSRRYSSRYNGGGAPSRVPGAGSAGGYTSPGSPGGYTSPGSAGGYTSPGSGLGQSPYGADPYGSAATSPGARPSPSGNRAGSAAPVPPPPTGPGV